MSLKRATRQSGLKKNRLSCAIGAAVAGLALTAVSGAALANEELIKLSQDERQWVMQGKDYDHSHYSGLKQINRTNVKDLKAVMDLLDRRPARPRRVARWW
jgi:methanol dehydrogenase (cytochrome c) subunit 1